MKIDWNTSTVVVDVRRSFHAALSSVSLRSFGTLCKISEAIIFKMLLLLKMSFDVIQTSLPLDRPKVRTALYGQISFRYEGLWNILPHYFKSCCSLKDFKRFVSSRNAPLVTAKLVFYAV